ncbi:hypothetical protein [Simiduia aestuariiviva]|uniref:Signal transduction histidine kinase n=1 Tax=Simiduia aestuariiviva TaxID=1510459 RepID=A0A839US45_9GAMM|nr:hypothetical protein [Simiduia aestuariiviva]MBB3168726.1 signal transduction histidine kinase [Simiduia aestuariiviva]
MSKWIFALIQFFPLSTFATFAFWYGAPSVERWLEAFQIGALLGLFQLAILLPQKKPLNRLVLAGNIYLIFGGIAVFLQQWWYLEIYDSLRESAILAIMVVVGCITTFTSSYGFIAVKDVSRKYSLWLLVATLSMLPFSIVFEGNRLYAAVIPIIFLAILHRFLSYVAKEDVLVQDVS